MPFPIALLPLVVLAIGIVDHQRRYNGCKLGEGSRAEGSLIGLARRITCGAQHGDLVVAFCLFGVGMSAASWLGTDGGLVPVWRHF